MESDNIHEQMAQYDFQVPIEVTVIFEENGEDELADFSTIKLENIKNIEEGNNNSIISYSIDANETTNKRNIELTQISTAKKKKRKKQENSKNMLVNDSTKEIRVKNADVSITENKDNSLTIKTDIGCQLAINSKKLKNNKENPNNQSNKPNNSPGSESYNEDDLSIMDGDNNNNHLNDLDNTTLMQINVKILKELLKTVSEHLLMIIMEHLKFLQYQNDKSINLYTLDSLKHCYLRFKYHYFDLSYCTVSTILLSQENNAGFIKRFLNHTLEMSKKKTGLNCTYKILETFYIEMIDWAKLKKKHLARFSSNNSNHNENMILKEQLQLNPSKHISFSNTDDLHNGKQFQNTCIFTSGPPGRQVQISIEPSIINQNDQEMIHASSVSQQNRQSSHKPSTIHQITLIGDKSSLIHQIGQPLTVEPSSISQNSQPSMVEPSLSRQKSQEISSESSLIHQNRWHGSSEEPSTIQQLKKQQLTTEPTSFQQNCQLSNVDLSLTYRNADTSLIHQNGRHVNSEPLYIQQLKTRLFNTEPTSFQQNSQPSYVEPSLTRQKTREISSEPSLNHQYRWHDSSEPSSIQQLKKQHITTEPTPFRQNTQRSNVDLSLTHQNSEPSLLIHQKTRHVIPESSYIQRLKTRLFTTDPALFQQNSQPSYVESSLTYQNAQQINAETSLIHQNRLQNNLKYTESASQQYIPHASRIQWSIQQLNKHLISNEPPLFQQNNQLNNVQPSSTHLNSEQTSAEPSLIQQNKKRIRNKTSTSQKRQHVNTEPLPMHQTRPQTTVEQYSIRQSRQPEPSIQRSNFMQGFGKEIKHPNQSVNDTNCNFSQYNPLSYANSPTSGRFLQHHPEIFQNRYHQPNSVPNYGTVPRPGPPNYNDAVCRDHQQYYSNTLNQLREQFLGYPEPETQNPDVLPYIDTRSSVSKDSGILSPLCSETSTDQQSSQMIEDILPSENTTPLITHVTSLNPNASHISEGNCIVCQKSTNSKCLGCYKCYYCSHECQTKDWTSHIFICRSASDAHKPQKNFVISGS